MKIVRPLTPLRQRMLEDMQIRNYSPHTIDGYLRYVGQFELCTWTEAHLRDGSFDQNRMRTLIEAVVTGARQQGFPRTRFIRSS